MADDITHLLLELREGRHEAQNRLLPLVYDHLKAIAHHRLSPGGAGQGLVTTELVHEAYLKLFDHSRLSVNDREHFFAVAATAMRQVVVDQARRRAAQKRGGGIAPLDLEGRDIPVEDRSAEILSLDDALRRLSQVDERLGRVVELRFFGGLSVEETAEVLKVDPRTVKRDWRKARALLYRELAGSETS
jgi:RNA polymerase sigma factor (TIGR02999 family)